MGRSYRAGSMILNVRAIDRRVNYEGKEARA